MVLGIQYWRRLDLVVPRRIRSKKTGKGPKTVSILLVITRSWTSSHIFIEIVDKTQFRILYYPHMKEDGFYLGTTGSGRFGVITQRVSEEGSMYSFLYCTVTGSHHRIELDRPLFSLGRTWSLQSVLESEVQILSDTLPNMEPLQCSTEFFPSVSSQSPYPWELDTRRYKDPREGFVPKVHLPIKVTRIWRTR